MKASLRWMFMVVGAGTVVMLLAAALMVQFTAPAGAQLSSTEPTWVQAVPMPLETAEAQRAYTLFGPKLITETTYTISPNIDVVKRDVSSSIGYASADVFVTVEGEDGDWLEWEVQFSPDRQNWAPNAYDYWTGEILQAMPATRQTTVPGNEYQQVQLAGPYLRLKMDPTAPMTVTAYVMYRKSWNSSELPK